MSEFNQHASMLSWNDNAPRFQYRQGLKSEIKIQKAAIGWGATLEAVQQEAITANNLLFEVHQEEWCQNPHPPQNLHSNFQQQLPWNPQGQFQQQQQQTHMLTPRDPDTMVINRQGQ
ncbi:hypothetical protein FRB93_012762 [Tulasnella sp. JGI-2019a]|nr:hypothetical protein FRB93_012762 [Tulasnella sp. JGI-2019a]